MCRITNTIGVIAVAGVLVGIPTASIRCQKANLRNVRTVTPGVLYRSGQLSSTGLERLIPERGIRTIVSLRDGDLPEADSPDAAEMEVCQKLGVRHVRIPPKCWWPEYYGPPAAEQGVLTFLRVMDDPNNYPVLLHCFAGTHRTGAMVAIYRMEYERWTNTEALAELRGTGYKNLDNEFDVLTYLDNYKPRWMENRTLPPAKSPH